MKAAESRQLFVSLGLEVWPTSSAHAIARTRRVR